MPLTRKQRKEVVEGVAGAASALGEAAVDKAAELLDGLDESDDDADGLSTPKAALRGKHGNVLKTIYEKLIDAIDDSALPLIRKHFSRAAMMDFITWLIDVKEANEVSLEEDDDDDDDEDDDDESFEGEEEEEEDEDEESEEEGEEAEAADEGAEKEGASSASAPVAMDQ